MNPLIIYFSNGAYFHSYMFGNLKEKCQKYFLWRKSSKIWRARPYYFQTRQIIQSCRKVFRVLSAQVGEQTIHNSSLLNFHVPLNSMPGFDRSPREYSAYPWHLLHHPVVFFSVMNPFGHNIQQTKSGSPTILCCSVFSEIFFLLTYNDIQYRFCLLKKSNLLWCTTIDYITCNFTSLMTRRWQKIWVYCDKLDLCQLLHLNII